MSTLTKNKKPNAFVRLTKHSEFTIGLVVSRCSCWPRS